MASITSIRNILAVALVAVVLPSTMASVYPPVCYTKVQKCCFNFHPCGTIIKKVSTTVDCSFQKCGKVCKRHCRHVKKKVPYQQCKKIRTRHGQTCKKVKVYTKHGYIWKKVCKPRFVHKRVCVTKYRIVKKKICARKCHRVCKKVIATCIRIRVLSFPKFCPKLSCAAFKITGNSKEPAHIVGKKSTLVKVINGKRTIKH